jgi:hypothetical protein
MKLNNVEGKEEYQVRISNRSAAFETLYDNVDTNNMLQKSKGKDIPVTGHTGPQGCETLRLSHFL